MTDFEKYLYSEHEKAPVRAKTTLQASEAFNRLQNVLGGDYKPVMEEIEAHYEEKVYQGYKNGFRHGIRFLMNVSTT